MNSEIINEVESSLAPSLRFDAFQEIDQDILVDEVVVDLLSNDFPLFVDRYDNADGGKRKFILL